MTRWFALCWTEPSPPILIALLCPLIAIALAGPILAGLATVLLSGKGYRQAAKLAAAGALLVAVGPPILAVTWQTFEYSSATVLPGLGLAAAVAAVALGNLLLARASGRPELGMQWLDPEVAYIAGVIGSVSLAGCCTALVFLPPPWERGVALPDVGLGLSVMVGSWVIGALFVGSAGVAWALGRAIRAPRQYDGPAFRT